MHNPPNDTLYGIVVISNPIGFHSRPRLFKEFVSRYNNTPGLQLILVELVSHDREFCCTDESNPFHVRVRTNSILWHKENMINIAIRKLTRIVPDWKYVAWIDADLTFYNLNWVQDTVTALQIHKVVQLFTHALDLNRKGDPMQTVSGFAYMFQKNNRKIPPIFIDPNHPGRHKGGIYSYGEFWHPGYAWAARRETLESIGYLMEFPILGSADHLMALGMVGNADRITSTDFSPDYLAAIREWQAVAFATVANSIGYVPGIIAHHFHGHKHNRGYQTRTGIIVEYQFDPYTDLKWNWHGVMELVVESDRQKFLAEDVKKYFWSRREDDGEPGIGKAK